jgi:hypothetical protein
MNQGALVTVGAIGEVNQPIHPKLFAGKLTNKSN